MEAEKRNEYWVCSEFKRRKNFSYLAKNEVSGRGFKVKNRERGGQPPFTVPRAKIRRDE